MVNKTPQLDYTSRDFQSIRDDMVNAIQFYVEEWTDHNESDFGIVLIDLLAGALDILHFYNDRVANEAFLATALKRESVVNLLALIDFELRSATPASVDEVFTIPVQAVDVTLPIGFQVQSISDAGEDPVTYELLAALVILAGATTGTAAVTEGTSTTEVLGTSTGLANQRFQLSQIPATTSGVTVRVFIDEGPGEVEWTEVDSFIEADLDDTVYTIERAEDEFVTIFFGDNVQGKIPVATSPIRVEFRVLTKDRGGDGVFGNLPANTITNVLSTVTVGGSPITVTATNPLAASGGEARQSIAEAKVQGPRSLRALERAVTAEDFKFFAEQFPGVAAALARVGQEIGLCCCDIGLIIAPEGGGLPSQQLKDDLQVEIDARKMIGTCVEILDPEYETVNLAADVFVFKEFNVADVEEIVRQALAEFFDLGAGNVQFGGTVFLSDVYALVDGTAGVRNLLITRFTLVPTVRLEVWSGDATFGTVTVGEKAVAETWTVNLNSPTTFTVTGTVSGLQSTTGVFGTPFESDNAEVSFLITAGVQANVPGDRATFRVLPLVGDVTVPDTVIVELGTPDLTFQSVDSSS